MSNSFLKIRSGINIANYSSIAAVTSSITSPQVNDMITVGNGDVYVYNGTTWEKSATNNEVSSVQSDLQGQIDNLTTDLVVEGTGSLYFTDSRAKTAVVVNSVDGGETDQAPSVLSVSTGLSSTLSAAKSYTDEQVAALVNSAPEVLDTLKELSDALGGDENFATTVANSIGSVSSSVSDLEARVSTTESDVDGLDIRINSLETLKDTQVIFVNKSGNDSTGNGGQHKPYASITTALASITDASPTKRYVIKVGAGSYTEASSLALKANVFVVGEQKESVRITATSFTLASDFSGSADNRSGMSRVTLLNAANFNWSTVTSAAGKLYFSEVSFGNTVDLYGHNNAIAQAQFDSCIFFGVFTVSGINVGVHSNNTHYSNIVMNQHPNGGMATIFAASGGRCDGTVTLTTTTNDFNRRCSFFAKNFYVEYVVVNGAASYADMNEGSLPRSRDRITSQNGGNIVYITSKAPYKTNDVSIGEPGYQYLYNFSYVHGSTDSDLYVVSMGSSYSEANVGRSIFIESDTYGLNPNVNGGDINITTAITSGSGVRGKITLSGREVDVSSKNIVNVANGINANDAVNKSQLDNVSSSLSNQIYSGSIFTPSNPSDWIENTTSTITLKDGVNELMNRVVSIENSRGYFSGSIDSGTVLDYSGLVSNYLPTIAFPVVQVYEISGGSYELISVAWSFNPDDQEITFGSIIGGPIDAVVHVMLLTSPLVTLPKIS